MLARRAPALFASSVLLVCLGCAQAENAVLIEARTQGDVESIQVTVIDRSGALVPSRSSPRPVRRTQEDVNEGAPIRIAVPLPGPMDVLVHIVATGNDPDDRFVATRCYSVNGLLNDTVLLVGPIGSDLDGDGDGFPEDPGGACRDPGAGGAAVACDFACTQVEGEDCDDADPTIYPGARELCRDDVDQDCDGSDAECEDRDGDGFRSCSAADAPGTCDCEDGVPEVNPGAEELCRDGVDQDCDGRDGLCDQDGDGFESDRDVGGSPDCDDTDPDVSPGATEVCTPRDDPDAIARDEDCNGFIDDAADCTGDDLDRDGSPACTGLDPTLPCASTDCDCNDCDPGIRPGALDRCGNGIDEDQRGGDSACPAVDVDGDGFPPASAGGSDCNDGDASVFPGAPDRCGDGVAQNCIGDTDCGTGDVDMDGYVPPADCGPDDATQAPGIAEACNQLDDDCDGVTNEVLAMPSAMFPQGTSGCVLGDARLGASCSGAGACVTDFLTSVFHCGGCRVQCNVPGGLRVADQCLDGVCDCSSDSSATGPCAAGSSCCDGAGCRDLQTDFDNCGYCDVQCGDAADRCAAGSCVCGALGRQCSAGTDGASVTCCGEGCVDTLTDEANCGVCGNVCGASSTCSAGSCVCDTGFDDCDFNPANGCETDIRTSIAHCGGCNMGCTRAGATATCVSGSCRIGTCGTLRADCDSMDVTGCETQLDTLTSCGGCGTGCSRPNAVPTCGGGTCRVSGCASGFGNCDGNDPNGCENTLDSLTSCGGCGTACNRTNASASCAGDVCRIASCTPGYGNCDGMDGNGCENTLDSIANCGGCGVACTRPNGTTSCAGDTCALATCASGFGNCDSMESNGCENTLDTLSNCGTCGTLCARTNAVASCTGDMCRVGSCAAGWGNCDSIDMNGCENSLDGLTHCGMCGSTCTRANATPSCTGDACHIDTCTAGWGNCDGNDMNGCENSLDSVTSCGMCGVSCARPNATASCAGDTCEIGSCNSGWSDCDGMDGNGCEAQVTTDELNCGGCGVSCAMGEMCVAGRCECGGTMGSVGGGAACTGLTDTCTAGSCTCGGAAACDTMRNDRCTAGVCVCGTMATCAGALRCMSATCS